MENNEKIVQEIDNLIMSLYRKFVCTNDNFRQVNMDEVFDISIGRTPPRAESKWFSANSNDIKWVSISDLGRSFYFVYDSSEYLTKQAVENFNVKLIPENTVLLSFKLTVGRVAVTGAEMTTNEAIAHFVTDRQDLTEYLYCYLRNFNYDLLGNTSSIATAVNSKAIKKMKFLLPTAPELEKFHNLVTPWFLQIKQLQIENQKLLNLKQAYLKKFFN